MPELLDQVADAIYRQHLLRPGQAILVAVSGGLDSLVLLHLLRELSARHRWRLSVAHLNHQLRGASSRADERLVERVASRWQLPCVIERAAVKELARLHGESIEMAARRARHEFLARTARRLRIRTVALAHHADDQVELFFLRLLRGAGAEGLGGMKWQNASPGDPKLNLVRPLLEQSRSALREYARQHKLRHREDASNAGLEVQRNRIRHELLPLLRKRYQPGLDRAVLRTMDLLAAESDFVSECAQHWLTIGRGCSEPKGRQVRPTSARPADPAVTTSPGTCLPITFSELPRALQRRVLQRQLFDLEVVAGFDLVEFLRLNPGKLASLGHSATGRTLQSGQFHAAIHGDSQAFAVRRLDGMVEIQRRRDAKPVPGESLGIRVEQGRGRCVYSQVRIDWQVVNDKDFKCISASHSQEFFDADRVGRSVLLRHWQAGDRFWPTGMRRPVKLQDFFTNLKVPRQIRHQLVVAVAEGGEVFWVEGMRIAEQFKLTQGTKRCLQWVWRRL